MSSSGKDSAIVVLEHRQPSRDICGVFLPRLLVQFEIGTQESRSQLGNELFAAVAFIAPAFATKVTVKPLCVFRPGGQFMGEGGLVAFGVAEGFERRHLYAIQFLRVIGAISAVSDRCAQATEKPLRRSMRATGSRVGTALA
jgi:hypothetical protein